MSAVGGASGAGSPHVVANPAAALMTRTRTAATPLAATLGRTGTAPSPLTRTTTVSRRLSAAQSPAAAKIPEINQRRLRELGPAHARTVFESLLG